MNLRRWLIPVTIAVGILLGSFGLFLASGTHGSMSASASGAGEVPQVDIVPLSRSQALVASTDDMTHTLYLPAGFSNYEVPFPTVFGVQMYGGLSEEQVSFSLAREGKVYWTHWRISWAAVEPTNTLPEDYRWSSCDDSILNATRAGQHLIVYIHENPDWAATVANGRIDKVDIGEFTQFVGALVERYDGDGWEDAPGSPIVDYWEFYNEPDGGSEVVSDFGGGYWGPFGDEYAQMLCAVYPVIKAANPRAQVVLGGIAYERFEDDEEPGPFAREFLDDVLATGGGQCLDVMNFHYYLSFRSRWELYGPGMSGKAEYLRSKLQAYGLGDMPMIVTETGYVSEPPYGTPELQARYVVEMFAQALAGHLDMTIWWTWIDTGTFHGDYGLLTESLQPKLAYFAYKAAATRLGPATFEAIWTPGESGLEGYRFSSRTGEPLYVLWANDGATHTVSLPLSQASIVDMYGNLVSSLDDGDDGSVDGQIQLSVGPNPVYVEAQP